MLKSAKMLFFYLFCYIFLCNVFCANAAYIDRAALKNKKSDTFKLSVIHFNDFHARFEETSPTSTKCVPENHECIGGFARLYSAINALKKEDPDAVVLNSGDDFQGTLWYNILKWNVTQYFMNMLPLDAHTIGNHEFDDGVAGIAPYLEHMNAPTLVANMDVSEEPDLRGLFNESIVIERRGVKIGLIGVLTKLTPTLASSENVKFKDEIEIITRVANRLTSEGVNIIIVLSHCGVDADREFASKINNIDIIVGAHSHTLLYPKGETPPIGNAFDDYPIAVKHETGETVLIVQADAFTRYLGHLKVTFDEDGKVNDWGGRPLYLNSSIPKDEKILELMEPFKELVNEIGQQTIGSSRVLMDKSNCNSGDCNIGNMLTDAFVDYCVEHASNNDTWTMASIGLINTGGIRTNIDAGDVTYEDLALAQPFNNQLQTFQLEGRYLLETIEYSTSTISRLQVSGLQIVYNLTNPLGSRTISAKVRCAACSVPSYSDIIPNAIYTLIAPSFTADGGDGYTAISKNKINPVNRGTDIDILVTYFIKHQPLYPEIDGRIKYLR